MKGLINILLVLIVLLMGSCIPKAEEMPVKSDDLIIDEVDENCNLYDYYVDSYGNEGVIVCKYENGDKKYIIALSADEGYEYWGPMDDYVYRVETVSNYSVLSTNIFGLMMLQNMYAVGMDKYPAQKWCYDKNYGDPYPRAASWRLPSYTEMTILPNINKLNEALEAIGGTPIDTKELYWSCTEDHDGYLLVGIQNNDYDRANRAVPKSFNNTTLNNKDSWIKKNKYKVRAIKYVYYHK